MENKVISTVSNVKIGSAGCVIIFKLADNIKKGAFVSIKSSVKTHYFKVVGFEISENNNLIIEASETGAWTQRIEKLMENTDFDIRNLKHVNIELIEDEKMIQNIHEMNGWA